MKTGIIFYSYSGITRDIAGKIQDACGGDLIEVKTRQNYNRLTAYTIGCLRARSGESDPIDPGSLDVTGYDLIVLGTPVWAWKPAPAVNAAIGALRGCEGKPAVIFATCGGQAGDTLAVMRRALEGKGVWVQGGAILTRREIGDQQKVSTLIDLVKRVQTS